MSRNTVSIPFGSQPIKVFLNYEDSAGTMHGPLEFLHEPRPAMVEYARQTLETMPTGWVYLRNMNGTKLLYFTTLLSYRCGLGGIEYGINTMMPTLTHEPGECDVSDPSGIHDEPSRMYVTLPDDTSFVSVRLSYVDGSKSKVQRFDRFHEE